MIKAIVFTVVFLAAITVTTLAGNAQTQAVDATASTVAACKQALVDGQYRACYEAERTYNTEYMCGNGTCWAEDK